MRAGFQPFPPALSHQPRENQGGREGRENDALSLEEIIYFRFQIRIHSSLNFHYINRLGRVLLWTLATLIGMSEMSWICSLLKKIFRFF